jgi:hypothetical protein
LRNARRVLQSYFRYGDCYLLYIIITDTVLLGASWLRTFCNWCMDISKPSRVRGLDCSFRVSGWNVLVPAWYCRASRGMLLTFTSWPPLIHLFSHIQVSQWLMRSKKCLSNLD